VARSHALDPSSNGRPAHEHLGSPAEAVAVGDLNLGVLDVERDLVGRVRGLDGLDTPFYFDSATVTRT